MEFLNIYNEGTRLVLEMKIKFVNNDKWKETKLFFKTTFKQVMKQWSVNNAT